MMHFPILWRYLLHDVSSLYVELIFTFCTVKCIINVNDDISTDGLRIQLQNELENFSFYLFSLQIYKTEFPAHTRGTNKYKNLFLKCQISIFKGGCSGSPGAVSTIYHPTTISAKSLSTWQHHFQKAFTEQQKHTGNWVHVHNLVSLIFWAAMTKPDVHGGGYAMGILYGFVFLLYFSVALLLLWFCSVPKNWDRMKKRW